MQAKWKEFSDEQLKEVAENLRDYTPEAQKAITVELDVRGIPIPAEKPEDPPYFTVPTRVERIIGRLAPIGSVLVALFFVLAIAGGARVGIYGALLFGVLISGGFTIYWKMRKGAPFSNLRAQLESKYPRDRSKAASLFTRIEPTGRTAAITILESVASNDPDENVRKVATAAIGKLKSDLTIQ